MKSTRVASRALNAARRQPFRQQCRLQSTVPEASGHTHTRSAVYGGLAGGAVVFGLAYAWYSLSGVKTAVSTAHQAKKYFDGAKAKLAQTAPEPNEALEWLRKQTYFYASFVPGGKGYIDTAFKDLDSVREKHGAEVDKIVKEAYEDLKDITSKDLSVASAGEAWQVLQKHLKRIGDLASDSAHEILANHPQLQSKVGDNIDQLRKLGDSFGPDAEKMVKDTWSQVQGIVAGGVGVGSIAKIKQLIEDKTEQVKKLGDQAWSKGVEELKPYLDKNPEIKELLDNNKQDLLNGNVTELWKKAKDASSGGNVDALKDYINKSVEKAGQKAGDLNKMMEKYVDQALPGAADKLMPKAKEFEEIIKNGDLKGMEQLVKDVIHEVKELIKKELSSK